MSRPVGCDSEGEMELYIWRPLGPEQRAVEVLSPDLAYALRQANAHVEKAVAAGYRLEYAGWGTEHYELFIVGCGEVVTNSND